LRNELGLLTHAWQQQQQHYEQVAGPNINVGIHRAQDASKVSSEHSI
jgi:hypothetical protein